MNILISGASDGIGLEIAKLLSPNHTIVGMAPNEEKLQKVAGKQGFDFVVGNVSIWKDCENAIEHMKTAHGGIDILINNAGLEIYGELDECDPQRIKNVIDVNYLGMVFLTKAAIPLLKKSKSPLIINMNSQASTGVSIGRSVYYSSKWATNGFTKNIGKELEQYGIRVSGIYPGAVNTKFAHKAGRKRDMSDAVDPVEVARAVEYVINQKSSTVIAELGILRIS